MERKLDFAEESDENGRMYRFNLTAVERRLQALADRDNTTVEHVRERLEKSGDIGELRAVIRHEAVEDLILKKAASGKSAGKKSTGGKTAKGKKK